jgi:thiol-disulfide isomerase/thioredoxin
VAGGVTIFDFYADWCGPCKQLAPQLEKLAQSTPNVYLRKIDIKDWESPVAKQYGLHSIPSVWIYDTNGRLAQKNLNGFNTIKAGVDGALKK